MQEQKVSIIIPVYNVLEEFLCMCLDSVLIQTYKNIEIIIVDDGSTNTSGIIVDRYAKQDDRVHVEHIMNGGVSRARNHGIDLSTGKYIFFLDADDWIEANTIDIAVKKIADYECELIGWNHFYNKDGKESKRNVITNEQVVFTKDKISNLLLDMITPEYDMRYYDINLGAIRGVWGKLYLADIIKYNHVRFIDKLEIGEDACFNIDYIKYINRAVFFNRYLNHYRIVDNSINHRFRKDIVDIRLMLLDEYKKRFENLSFYNSIAYNTCYTREVLSCIVNCMNKNYCNRENHDKLSSKLKNISELLNDMRVTAINKMEKDVNFFTKKELFLLFIMRKRFAFLLYVIGFVW
jgi:glycosyltransferase involved in cell wall biosynthesis